MNIQFIDKLNSDKFKNNHTDDYICVMCECKVSLDDSMSHQGYNLVCNRCYYRLLEVLNLHYLIDDIHKAGAYRQWEEEENARLYNETDPKSVL